MSFEAVTALSDRDVHQSDSDDRRHGDAAAGMAGWVAAHTGMGYRTARDCVAAAPVCYALGPAIIRRLARCGPLAIPVLDGTDCADTDTDSKATEATPEHANPENLLSHV